MNGDFSVSTKLVPCFWFDPAVYRELKATTFFKIVEFVVSDLGVRNALEFIPHVTQCLLLLGMGLERYILVCHPTKKNSWLSKPKRLVFYILLLALIGLLSAVPVIDIIFRVYSGAKPAVCVLNCRI